MRKTIRRRPEVETLESMTLLSGVAAAAHPVAALTSVELSGTVKGTLSASGKVKGSGSLSPVGKITFSGHQTIGVVQGSETLSSKHGKISLTTDLRSIGGGSYTGEYTITGGTKSYAGASGEGSLESTFLNGKTFIATLV